MSSAGTFTTDGHANALPPGTRLGEFEIKRVIGVGGFGIVYLAFDHGLEREVAIKEYMPSSLASRTATLHVSLTSPNNEETFKLGLRSFVNEAKLLARFDHRSLIKVHRFWEERGTAYMVMPLLRGRTLREARRQMTAPPDEAWLRGVLDPVLGALEVLHREDVYHRDIAPDNILVGDDGVPMLLDFGAARHVIQGRSQTLTAILKPSYAPIEQYGEATNLRQGAWTDLYALGATFHYLITESPPLPATVRTVSDDAAPLASAPRPGVSEGFLRTVDWMLSPRPADRPQSVAELREVLAGRTQVPMRTLVMPSPTAWQRTEAQINPPTDIEIEPDETRLLTHPAPLSGAPASVPAPAAAAVPASVPPSVPRSAPRAGAASGPPAEPSAPVRAAPAVPEAWSASSDRVLPPGASGPAQRSLTPKLAAGAAVVVAAAGLLWFMQRPASGPGQPLPAVPASAAAPGQALAASGAASAVQAAAGPAAPASAPDTAASLAASAVAATAPTATAPASAVTAVAPAPKPAVQAAAPTTPGPATPGPVNTAAGRKPGPANPPAPTPVAPSMTVDNAALRPLPGGAASASAAVAPASQQRPAPARPAPVVPERRTALGGLGDSPPPLRPPPEAGGRSGASTDGALAPVPAGRDGGDPRSQCGGRMLLALHKCLVRECVKPQYFDHPECVQVRAIEERARSQGSP